MLKQDDWKEIERDYNKFFCNGEKGIWRDDIITPSEILNFFHSKFTELQDQHQKTLNKGKKVGRDEVLSQIKGLGVQCENSIELETIAILLNKLR